MIGLASTYRSTAKISVYTLSTPPQVASPHLQESVVALGDQLLSVLQLTQKKLQLQFKAIDQVVQTFNKETGQKEALSYRCQDMDRVVPTLMGVSKVRPQLCSLHRAAATSQQELQEVSRTATDCEALACALC